MPLHKLSREERDVIVRKADERFRDSIDHETWTKWRKHAIKAFQYVEGEQWTADELRELRKRGQPETVNNQLGTIVRRVMGQYVRTRVKTSFRGRNAPDDQMGNTLTALNLHIEQQSGLRYEEKAAFRDALISGIGWDKLVMKRDQETSMPWVDFEHVDTLEMYLSPFSFRYDLEDADWISQARWLSMKKSIAFWPEFEEELRTFVSGFETPTDGVTEQFKKRYVHFKNRMVRPVEQWFRVYKRVATVVVPDLFSADVSNLTNLELERLRESHPGAQVFTDTHTEMHMITYIGHVLLEHNINPLGPVSFYPYTLIIADRRKDGMPYSIIKDGIPQQEAVNKRESKMLHLLNKDRVIYERGAVVTMGKDDLAEEIARPDGQIELDGTGKRFEIDKGIDLATGQMQAHIEAKKDLHRTTGVNEDTTGQSSPIRSGSGVRAREEQSKSILADLFDNLLHTKKLRAKKIYHIVKYFYTNEMTFAVTDDVEAPGARPQQFTINTKDGQNNVGKGSYDIVVTQMPDFDTMRQEEFFVIAQTLGKIAKAGPIFARVLIEASDIRNKGKIIEMLEQHMQKPKSEPVKMTTSADWNELPKEEKIALALQDGNKLLAQAVQQGGGTGNMPKGQPPINILQGGRRG
jgi:hypothetical protein